MASWHSKKLGDGVEAFRPTEEVQKAFLTLSMAGQSSFDTAVFSQYDSETNVITIYFTPSAELLARAFGAIPCEKPIPEEGFGLMVGDDRAREAQFPEYYASRQERR